MDLAPRQLPAQASSDESTCWDRRAYGRRDCPFPYYCTACPLRDTPIMVRFYVNRAQPPELPSLQELQARRVPRATPERLFEILDGIPAPALEALRLYLARFAEPAVDGKCIRCGTVQAGIVGALLGGFRWGLVHGEGVCGRCRYPARAYHRKVGPLEFLPLLLQYHPDTLEERTR